jgi:hypothetical protein
MGLIKENTDPKPENSSKHSTGCDCCDFHPILFLLYVQKD